MVLAFDLFGDVDGRLDGFSITATGELDEVTDMGLVKVHLDENKNLAADPSEFLDQSTYTADDGVIDLNSQTLCLLRALPSGS